MARDFVMLWSFSKIWRSTSQEARRRIRPRPIGVLLGRGMWPHWTLHMSGREGAWPDWPPPPLDPPLWVHIGLGLINTQQRLEFTDSIELTYTPWSIKNKTPNYCPYLRQILTNFQNYFTDTLSRKFAMKILLQIPPHLNGVATLTCEILVYKNRNDWKHSNGRRGVRIVKRMWLR